MAFVASEDDEMTKMTMKREGRVLDVALETENTSTRRTRLSARLRETVARAYARAPAVRRALDAAGVQPAEVTSIDDLPRLPVTLKDDLGRLQNDEPPLAGLLADEVGRLARLYASPGPLFVPQGAAPDYWRFRMAFAATGLVPGDIVLNTLSYHLTPGGLMVDSGLRAIGCVVIPAGVGQTDLQVRVASALRATGYAGTPSFLRTILHRARELSMPLAFEVAFSTGEMLPDGLRGELEGDFGLHVRQGYASADVGVLSYECGEKGGMHVQPELIVELLDLESGRAITEPGQPGHVVATTFDAQYPLLRFGTGDISAYAPDDVCGCGRTAKKLVGIVGRIGDAVKVKGLFVRGAQIEEVMKTFPAVARFQAIVTRDEQKDSLRYLVELMPETTADSDLPERLGKALDALIKVRGQVEITPPGTIPQGTKRIDDRRVWH
jgi:phenylacetate-CoA ligase